MSRDESWSSQSLSARDSGDDFEPQNSIEDGVTPYHLVVSSGNCDENSKSVSTREEGSKSSEPPLNSEEGSKRSPQPPIISSENDDGNSQLPLSAACDERSSILQNLQGGGSFQQPMSSGNDDNRSSSTHPVSPSLHQVSSSGNAVGNNSISTSLANNNVSTESFPVSVEGSSPPTSLADCESPLATSFGDCGSSYSHCSSLNEGNTSPQIYFVDGSPNVSRNGDPILGGLSSVPTFGDSDFFIQV